MHYTRAEMLSLQHTNTSIQRKTRRRLFRYHLVSPTHSLHPKCGSTDGRWLAPSLAFLSERGRALNIGVLNCRSIGNKSAPLVECISSNSFDLFLVCETWHAASDDVVLSSMMPPGFSFLERSRSVTSSKKKGGGGVAMYYRNPITAVSVKVSTKCYSFEFMCAKMQWKQATIIVLLIYRPGSTAASNAFFEELSAVLEALAMFNCPTLITGDLNLKLLDSTHADARRFGDMMKSFGLVQLVDGPTHIGGGKLDLV